MQQSITTNIENRIRRIVLDLRRRWVLRRLSKGLSYFTNKELAHLRVYPDLATDFRGRGMRC